MEELVTLGLPQIETDEVRVGGLLKFGAFGKIYNANGVLFQDLYHVILF